MDIVSDVLFVRLNAEDSENNSAFRNLCVVEVCDFHLILTVVYGNLFVNVEDWWLLLCDVTLPALNVFAE